VLLRQRVRQGALVFVRLLEPATQFRSFPVAFRARQVLERENGALYELKLSQVWPAADSQGAEATSMMHIAQGRAAGWN